MTQLFHDQIPDFEEARDNVTHVLQEHFQRKPTNHEDWWAPEIRGCFDLKSLGV
jgi:hypothetical protein